MNEHPATSDHAVTLDPENPWLGLFSYTEETRAFFHGRDEEAAELARRVQHKILTVLFGQSGLGKTSLLRAGLVPRLRKEAYCPVYVRIDYAAGSPLPSLQIRQAIYRTTLEAGHWTRPGASVEGDTLWELLHHRGDLLRDADGHALTPLLIFDQFEEIFTLGQADDAGKQRAQQFLEDLADLVENRAPAELEARMDEDEALAEEFDFGRADYRVLITLREDYLAYLESVKDTMPSITQNRMRLARMNGAQALDAVLKPGGKLVTPEVAEAIVRFVAGGSELANAEIEPSLLSLVCRELNTLRQAQGREEISTDLLAGSRETILSEFYERSLADQPEGVRRVIEDELLTESGYRESLAEERVLKALADAGAAPDALPTLVNRRLLHIEERLDMRRVELTHDVLCSVVVASRNSRREREAREQAERQLAEQREREAAVHRTLRRTRMAVGVCIVLLCIAIAGGVFGYFSTRRAQTAQAEAKASRTRAEKLVSFLIEDFYNQLAPTGRLETLGTLAQKTVAYYDSLPPALVTKQTQINRAMALVREGTAQQSSGKSDAAFKSFDAAQVVFKKLRAAGDHGEPVTYGLALVLYNEGYGGETGISARGTTAQLQKAANLLRPLAYGANPSRRVRQLYADDLNVLTATGGISQQKRVANAKEARKLLADLGALDLSDLNATSSYADTTDSEARALTVLGHFQQAQKLEQQVYDLSEKILARRPDDLHALADRWLAADLLSMLADRRHDAAAATDYAKKAARAGENYVRFNPSDLPTWQGWMKGLGDVAHEQWESGEIARSIATLRSIVALGKDPRAPSGLAQLLRGYWVSLSIDQAEAGDSAAAEQSMQTWARANLAYITGIPSNSPRHRLAAHREQAGDAALKLFEGAPRPALTQTAAVLAQVEAIKVPSDDTVATEIKNVMLVHNLSTAARAAVREGRYAQAETWARKSLAVHLPASANNDPRSGDSFKQTVLARAIAMQGRKDEARKTLQPALDYYQQEFKAGAYGTGFRNDYAYALYVSAISQPSDAAGRKQRKAALDQAAKLIAGASTEAQRLTTMRYVSGLIAAARANPTSQTITSGNH